MIKIYLKLLKENMNVANFITLMRFPLGILFLILFIILPQNQNTNLILLGVLLISCISDCADGFIARQYNMITDIGKIIDPMADKFTQLIVFAIMGFKNIDLLFSILLFTFIEISLIFLGSVIINQKGNFPSANIIGKITTILFYVCIFICLLFNSNIVLIYNIIVIASLVRFINYMYRYLKEN